LRARRDRAIAAIVRETDEVWHATLAGLLRRAQKEGAIAPVLKPDDAAGVIVAMLKGIFILPADARDARRLDRTLDQLERWLGLSATEAARARGRDPAARRRSAGGRGSPGS